jgi:hypothetical protein
MVENMNSQADLFERYLKTKYESYRKINTMATRNNERELNDIYIPLKILEQKKNGETNESLQPIIVDGFPTRFAVGNRKNLIVDTAGMGKSTLVKKIFLDLVDSKLYIPIFVELRRLSDHRRVITEICEMLGIARDESKTEDVEKLFTTGNFVFILDGYDEIPLDYRDRVTMDVASFIKMYDNNIFIMTSRPEDSFMNFNNFDVFRIEPLTKEMAFNLLEKHDNGGETSKLLIKKLNENVYETISEYLTNPLLVSMLYAAFDFKQTIPLKKHLFYEQVYDAYFEKHDLTKGGGFRHQKQSNLDSYDFDRVLRAVGFKSLKSQKVEYNYNEFLETIKSAQEACKDLKFKATDFRADLLEAVPLFCKEGYYHKWVHKSMQEYFAARYIYMDVQYCQDELLSAMYNSSKIEHYYNLFDIYYDIDVFSFKKNIVLPLLYSFRDFFQSIYHEVKGIPDNLVRERIGLLFLKKVWMANNKSETADEDFIFLEKVCALNHLNYTNMVSYTVNDSRFCIAKKMEPQRILLSLLRVKMPELFISSVPRKTFDVYKLPDYSFEEIKGVDDFSQDENAYRFCNYSIVRAETPANLCLDYEKILEEIENIETEENRKDEIKELIAGL